MLSRLSLRRFGRAALISSLLTLGLGLLAMGALFIAAQNAYGTLPSLDPLTDYRPKIPLRVYTADHAFIGEFGEERRRVSALKDFPVILRQALLAAEDDRFYLHSGVDLRSVARAAWNNFRGRPRQGASTITQQLARNFFLTPEQTFKRKFFEALLALKIENAMTKDQILEVYMNQIYLGQRAHGFASASEAYFGKPLARLTLAEAAMLAGLPKAPSAYNPVVNPKRARLRQLHILERMRLLGHISEAEEIEAREEPLRLATNAQRVTPLESAAAHAAEMARQFAVDLFGDKAYTLGLRVETTLLLEDQKAAHAAARAGLMSYDQKRGYRGPEGRVKLPEDAQGARLAVDEALEERPASGDLIPAIALEASPAEVKAALASGDVISIRGPGLSFAARALSGKASSTAPIRRGSIIRVALRDGRWEISQIPEAAVAFVAANTRDGAIRALVGGFDFNLNKFNRAAQAWRQPGSAFKPFIYSAALEKGLSPGSMVNDAPFFSDPGQGAPVWAPKNYDGRFEGPITLRRGLTLSKNMVSVRIMDRIGPHYAQDYATRFGFDAARHPPYLTLALGAGAVTPLQLAGAYAVFANGGYRVEPYLVAKITTADGRVLYQASPRAAGSEGSRAIDERNAFLMDNMLLDVTARGTAAKASAALKRFDLAGKTGTTNDAFDAWFAGYHPDIVAVAWMGFDQPKSLGSRETGGGVALPIWIDYMKSALKNTPPKPRPPAPDGIEKTHGDFHFSEFPPEPARSLGAEEPETEELGPDGLPVEPEPEGDGAEEPAEPAGPNRIERAEPVEDKPATVVIF